MMQRPLGLLLSVWERNYYLRVWWLQQTHVETMPSCPDPQQAPDLTSCAVLCCAVHLQVE